MRYRDCGIRDSSGSHSYSSENGSEDFTRVCYASNKSISARELFRIRPEIKRKYFWGDKLWTQSYFVEAIGSANEEVFVSMYKTTQSDG
ncbi:MAG: transposase [Nitrosomonas sp.]|nr:transposase [Nitrosomonas sp.]